MTRWTDTVNESVRMNPGRNDPCPCGSGKRFKHCHGSQATAPPASTPTALGPQEIGALVALVSQDRLQEAESRAQSLLTEHPKAGMLWKILSVTLVRQGKDALAALRRAAQLLPQDAEAHRNLGAALHDQGQWAEALASLRLALAIRPDDVASLIDAADATKGLGRAREAVPLYQRALQLSPREIEARNNLGNAFLELGQHVDAVGCYRWALDIKPDDPQILCNLGNALRQIGRLEEALAASQRAITLEPRLSVAHNELGLIFAAQGQLEAAAASYRQALQLNPRYVDALNNLGNLLRDMGQRREALPLYAQAIDIEPQRAESHCNLGTALFESRRIDEAVACYAQALALQPDYAPAHLSLALALRQLRRPAEAEISCRAALAIDPSYVQALSFLGELQADRGQFNAAEDLFQRAIALNPDFAPAYSSIATHRKMTCDDAAWLQGASALLAKARPLMHEIGLRYALGKCCDDLGQYPQAFEHYRQANDLSKRNSAHYDRARLSQRVDAIIQTFEPSFLRRAESAGSDSQLPVFIVGMPRSGTSLAEQILASHPAVFGAGEVIFWNAAYDAFRHTERATEGSTDLIPGLARDYLAQLATLSTDAERVVDKMPANFLYAGLIHAAFPRARIIHMRRHPLDTCVSIYFQNFFNIGPYANDLDNLAHFYHEYLRVTEHWRQVLPACALLEVPYEALTEEPETWSRRMVEFIGLPWDPKCLDFHQTDRVVITASKWQVRQKISKSSVGRWRNYEPFIGALHALESAPSLPAR